MLTVSGVIRESHPWNGGPVAVLGVGDYEHRGAASTPCWHQNSQGTAGKHRLLADLADQELGA